MAMKRNDTMNGYPNIDWARVKQDELEQRLKVVPLGKYRGEPLSVLKDDPRYVQWLLSQKWFVQRFPLIVEAIENGSYVISLARYNEFHRERKRAQDREKERERQKMMLEAIRRFEEEHNG
jgi:hypothetical protein